MNCDGAGQTTAETQIAGAGSVTAFEVGDMVFARKAGRYGFVRQIREDKIGSTWTVWPRGKGVPTGYVEIAVSWTRRSSRIRWYRPDELEAP